MDDEIIDWKALFGALLHDVEGAKGLAEGEIEACRGLIDALAGFAFAEVAPHEQRLTQIRDAFANAEGGGSSEDRVERYRVVQAQAQALAHQVREDVDAATLLQPRIATVTAGADTYKKRLTLIQDNVARDAQRGAVDALVVQCRTFTARNGLTSVAQTLGLAEASLQAVSGPIDTAVGQGVDDIVAQAEAMVTNLGNIRDNAVQEPMAKAALTADIQVVTQQLAAARLIVNPTDRALAAWQVVENCAPAMTDAINRNNDIPLAKGRIENKCAALRAHARAIPHLKAAAKPFETYAEAVQQRVSSAATWVDFDRETKRADVALDAMIATAQSVRPTADAVGNTMRSFDNIMAPVAASSFSGLYFNDLANEKSALEARTNQQLATAAASEVAGMVAAHGTALKKLLDRALAEKAKVIDGPDRSKELAALSKEAFSIIATIADATVKAALEKRHKDIAKEWNSVVTNPDEMVKKTKLLESLVLARNLLTDATRESLKQRPDDTVFATLKQEATRLGGKAPDAVVDTQYRAAIEVQFGVNLRVEENIDTRMIPKLYLLLSSVPASHMKNKSLKTIDYGREPPSAVNYYRSSEKLISFNAMPENNNNEAYKPDQGSSVSVSYYSATTLHEVGHSVDDALDYMGKNMTKNDHGGWKSDETLDSVADAFGKAGFYGRHTPHGAAEADLKKLLKAALEGALPDKPATDTAALGSLRNRWRAITGDATVSACLKARTDKSPWYGGKSRAAELTAGNRVYHESYAGQWSSYLFAARAATGISEYQWRAAGEWFAEIYALYYLDKLDKTKGIGKMIADLPDPDARP